jgi:hypothetical protein
MGYRVLPSSVINTDTTPEKLVAMVIERIEQRREGYAKLITEIADPKYEFVQLLPLVDALLPSVDTDVQTMIRKEQARSQAAKAAREGIVLGLGILAMLLTIFPPTAPLGLALGAVAAAGGLALGYEDFQQGLMFERGIGAGIFSREQEAAAGMLMFGGLVRMTLSAAALAGAGASAYGMMAEGGAASSLAPRVGAPVTGGQAGGTPNFSYRMVRFDAATGEGVAVGTSASGQVATISLNVKTGVGTATLHGPGGFTAPIVNGQLQMPQPQLAGAGLAPSLQGGALQPTGIPGFQPFGFLGPGPSPRPFALQGPYPRRTSFILQPAPGPMPLNWFGQPVTPYPGHIGSPLDPAMSVRPRFVEGPFTDAERAAFLRGEGAGLSLAPHHRHQLSVQQSGGMIDELPGPGHPQGNIHTTGPRHPGPSFFSQTPGGEALRQQEIADAWRAKGARLVQIGPDQWVDLGP